MIKKSVKNLVAKLFSDMAKKEDIQNLYRQIEALMQIQNGMQGRTITAPLRGWAISPDAISWVLLTLTSMKNPSVIEFGCGQSTVIIASFLKKHGGKLISVEHDSVYLQKIQEQITSNHLQEQVQFVLSLPKLVDGVTSYDLSAVPNMGIDLGLVDGPPYHFGDSARQAPLKWAVEHLNPGGAIYLDDANRPEEQRILKYIKSTYPNTEMQSFDAEKGLVRISWNN